MGHVKRPRKKHPELRKSPIVDRVKLAMVDDGVAATFLEEQRWGDHPTCPHCQADGVYRMADAATGGRNRRFLWFCRSCRKKYTVRTGTVMEASHIALRHWCYAFWQMATDKGGVSALETRRHCQIGYRAALFMLHRIRWAMANDAASLPKLDGIVEADETYVGGKPRIRGEGKRGRGTLKTPVFACVQRQGQVRVKVAVDVTGDTLKSAIREVTKASATIVTDELSSYRGIGKDFQGGHHTVNHSAKEYARPPKPGGPKHLEDHVIHTNTVENFFGVLKRGLDGAYIAVSKEHLPRYLAEFAWRFNVRDVCDGDRIALIIRDSEGKRLRYRAAA